MPIGSKIAKMEIYRALVADFLLYDQLHTVWANEVLYVFFFWLWIPPGRVK